MAPAKKMNMAAAMKKADGSAPGAKMDPKMAMKMMKMRGGKK